MPASPARAAAFKILLRVERESAYAVELLHSGLLDDLLPEDRNLATEIVMGVLRWRSLLDRSIAFFSFSPVPKLDLEVLTALRMGAYQIKFLERIPAHAAVHETVELVKQSRKTSAAGLANAVMRKILAQHRSGRPVIKTEGLAMTLAHPEWLVTKWGELFGQETARKICEYDQQVPATMLRLSTPGDGDQLRSEGIETAPGELLRSARRVIAGDVIRSAVFQAGRVAIQDEGSQLVAALLGAGKRILDCCAAPGGKTASLATRLPEAEVFAAELHPHRARLLRTLAPQPNVHVVAADALRLPFAMEFDRVLADVPCSGTGTLARNPEIKWRLRYEDLRELQAKQIAILLAAMDYVAPGGRLVYSTCSLEPEENGQVVEQCLEQNAQFRVVPVQEELSRLSEAGELAWKDPEQLASGEFLRTVPGIQPCDGFFAAILQKNS